MIIMHVDLEPGYRKADINSIPSISSETIFGFISQVAGKSGHQQEAVIRKTPEADLRVDYVQVRRVAEVTDVKALIFPPSATLISQANSHVRVGIKVDTKKDSIADAVCDHCVENDTCPHMLAFIFWLHRKSTDIETHIVHDFWGHEVESLFEDSRSESTRIRDLFTCDELRTECDGVAVAVTDVEGTAFLEAVLDEMDSQGLRECALYRHCREVLDEFEPIYVHHTLLDVSNNGIKDAASFLHYMEDQSKMGMFDRLADISKTNYKTSLWLETQYMRLRCSLIHRIASRKDTIEDEQILESLFCKNRDCHIEEKQQMKQHKRFILKQTEKLENKTYHECGLLLSESYPYICASPDGITDDHIVEIKAPKTDEEFEKYLEGRETIAPKYMAQIQIQMYAANVTKALYCVLSPTFDTNGALHYVWVQADMEFVASLLSAAEDFWKEVVFPRLMKIYWNS